MPQNQDHPTPQQARDPQVESTIGHERDQEPVVQNEMVMSGTWGKGWQTRIKMVKPNNTLELTRQDLLR